ncbi:MAG: lysophospholipid acyltransferase family protein [Pirellulaceae bacterium]|nr:1-acyl-sn-glycerol-3-phosphate acyltransferase [Planctomycetales bacterium]MCA9266674.1 1-acyl-sn-glycerol-3-phosphate acyltransferase [Planctomycetales bacterium]
MTGQPQKTDKRSSSTERTERIERTWAQRWSYNASRATARLVGTALFSMRCFGRENWPREGGALVCSNHQSVADPVLVGLACPRRLNYLARENLFKIPGFGALIRFYDAIPINRDGMGIGGLKETLRRLKRGEMVLIFPEGTRTDDGQMRPLHAGFCAVARRGRVPIVPVGLAGAYEAWPRKQILPSLTSIHLAVGEPIWPSEFESWDDARLVAELAGRMETLFQEVSASRIRSVQL